MLSTYCLLFIIYAFLGWCGELLLSLIILKRCVNRGFLTGPWCPIYGVVSVALTLLLSNVKSWILVFLLSMIICSFIEYLSSLILEKIFKMRWWDYSKEFLNINGRICLSYALLFGVAGILVIKIGNPIILKIFEIVPNFLESILAFILITIFVINVIFDGFRIFKLKNEAKTFPKDATEEVRKALRRKHE